MATYKVPQDVEADDKLIGPFSFRQFIYLIAVVLAGIAAWGLAQIFIGLAIIPLPVIVFFGALALPLRKDQPMEVYMAAMVSYFLKPRKRLWDPEGIETLIEITAPKTYIENRTKGLSQSEAEQRLGYLANIVDSGGWAIRGTNAAPSTSINNDIFIEAQSAVDVFDDNNSVAQSFNHMMAEKTIQAKEEAVELMKTTQFAPTPPPAVSLMPVLNMEMPEFDPYPTDIQQTVIQPLNDPSHMAEQNIQQAPVIAPKPTPAARVTPTAPIPTKQTSVTTSDSPVPADIINLVNNTDLTVATLQSEGHRIHKKLEDQSEEVVITLR
ncbi:MAG: uncharacterized protein JWN28_829 [Candidatus Saccharibacteria bacterium]|nr:uncharacterized protein [Candidatus Saccharibacteria bacterium]